LGILWNPQTASWDYEPVLNAYPATKQKGRTISVFFPFQVQSNMFIVKTGVFLSFPIKHVDFPVERMEVPTREDGGPSKSLLSV